MESLKLLEKKRSQKEKELESINVKIENVKKTSHPLSIMDRVKTMGNVLKIAKPTKEELAVMNYSGKSKRMLFAKYMMVMSLISEVLNEGHEFAMDGKEGRHYPYFHLSSGFVFIGTGYDDDGAGSTSASRLCLKSRELAEYAGKVFLKEYKNAIMMK
jgi:hypothetical protein